MPLPRWPLTGIGFGSVSSGMGSQPLNSNFLPLRHQQHQFQTLTAYPHFEEKPQTPLMGTSTLQGGPSHLSNRRHPVPEFREKNARMMPPSTQIADKQAVVLTRKNAQQQQKDLQQQQLDENTRKTKSKLNKSNAPGGESALGATDAEVDKQVDENVASYLSHNEDNADVTSNTFSTLQPSSLNCKKNELKAIASGPLEDGAQADCPKHQHFSFKEVGSIHPSTSKVLCCHFSSDGKFLVSAGHEKKVLIWNLDLFQPAKTAEEHSHIITDVRFRPNSTLFATSSFDRTVQIWDATRSSKSLLKFVGHGEQVMSLDFHPRKSDLLCSCDSNDEIRLWNVNQSACTSVFKGASRQVRFQPQVGNLLAAASGSAISLIDVETKCVLHKLEGHSKDISSICWDTSGNYVASVSEDSARVWSASGGKCIHELNSNGNKFGSCAFHPGYSLLLVIGSYQSLVLWNSTKNNETITVNAHDGIIASLADSPRTEMIASASHDQWVKLWK